MGIETSTLNPETQLKINRGGFLQLWHTLRQLNQVSRWMTNIITSSRLLRRKCEVNCRQMNRTITSLTVVGIFLLISNRLSDLQVSMRQIHDPPGWVGLSAKKHSMGEGKENMTQEMKRIILLRIPRTGSSLLSSTIRFPFTCSCFRSKLRLHQYPFYGKSYPQLDLRPCVVDNCRDMVTGIGYADWAEIHSAFALAGVERENIDIFTILRDPVQRIVSEYSWVSDHIGNSCRYGHRPSLLEQDYSIPCNYSIENFIDDQIVKKMMHNHQVKMVAGCSYFDCADVYDNEEMMLETAKRNLLDMRLYGIYERMNETIRQIKNVYENLIEIDAFILNTQEMKISHEVYKRIYEYNHLDVQFYKFALQNFIIQMRGSISSKKSVIAKKTIARCASGLCESPQIEPTPSQKLFLGGFKFEEFALGDCIFNVTKHNHSGTYLSNSSLFVSKFDFWDWYRSQMFVLEDGTKFITRRHYPVDRLQQHGYILVLGTSESMVLHGSIPFTVHLESLIGIPVITIAPGVGTSFSSLLERMDLEGKTVRYLSQNAIVVIVEEMSGRPKNISICNTEILCRNMCSEDGATHEWGKKTLGKSSGLQQDVRGIQKHWMASNIQLIQSILDLKLRERKGSVIFLHHGMEEDIHSFPPFVTGDMVRAVSEEFSNKAIVAVDAVFTGPMQTNSIKIREECLRHHDRISNLSSTIHKLSNCSCSALSIKFHLREELNRFTALRLHAAIKSQINYQNQGGSLYNKGRLQQSDEENFFFLLTTGSLTVTSRAPMMAIESICKHHARHTIYIFVYESYAMENRTAFEDLFKRAGCRIYFRNLFLDEFFLGSPLEAWFNQHKDYIMKGQFWYSHLTDIFRLVALWKYGGWYVDFDFIFLKSVSIFRNTVFYESKQQVLINNALSHFDRGHVFLEKCMHRLRESYNRDDWISAGPRLVTRSWDSWKHQCKGPTCITVIESSVIYPVPYNLRESLFSNVAWQDDEIKRIINGSFAIHYWNHKTSDLPLQTLSPLYRIYLSNCIICNLSRR